MKPGSAGWVENSLVVAHAALAVGSAYQIGALDTFFGGLFSTWRIEIVLLIPAAISIATVIQRVRSRPVFGFLAAATTYWLLASVGYVMTALEEGEMVAGHAIGTAGTIVALGSLWYIGQRLSESPRLPGGSKP